MIWGVLKTIGSHQITKVMRCILILMCLTVLHTYAANSYSQTARLSVELNNVTIQDVLDEIEDQSEFYFLFNKKLVDVDRKIDISVDNQDVQTTLARVFSGTNTDYIVIDRQIVLSPVSYLKKFKEPEPQAVLQEKTIRGTVTDESGNPLPGVTIVVKGTGIGTISDDQGSYELQVPEDAEILTYSFVGMRSQEVEIMDRTTINVEMEQAVIGIDEVVAVGYGTQRRATLTGSVTQVAGDEVLKDKGTTNMAAALQGTIPGLTITRNSSRPGNEGIDITLRGGISVNETHPMIVIDGVEAYQWELSQINMNDVESISVLKDASAAIYGTKAGAGVILINTKRGTAGKPKLTYSGRGNANIVGKRFPVADGETFGKMFVHATENDAYALLDEDGNPQYSWWMWPEEVWRSFAAGEKWEGVAGRWRIFDPSASTDQFDAVYGTTWGQSHNLAFNAGNEDARVMASLGYTDDRSLVDIVYDGQKKYNFRTNADYQINDFIHTALNVSFDKRNVSMPTLGVGYGVWDFYVFPLYNPYGQFYDTFGGRNLLAHMTEGGRTNNSEQLFRLGGDLNIDLNMITEGLSVTGSANVRNRNYNGITRRTRVTMYDWSGETQTEDGFPDYSRESGAIFNQTSDNRLYVRNTQISELFQTYNAFLNYDRTFSSHHVKVMTGMIAEKSHYQRLYGYRENMIVDELDDINLGDPTTAENSGGSHEEGLISYLGRFNYDYEGTFLIEGLFRRDGSSRFSPENRWANFYGISGGIRLSEFTFVQNWNVFDHLKLRASYGETGSQTGIAYYDYISSISSGVTVFGYTGEKHPTSWISSMTSEDRTWERVATTNLGIDFTVLNNRLSGVVELFNRANTGMLISVTYPQTLGASAPKTNSGNFTARGWETQLNWRDNAGDFSYNVGLSLSDARTEVTEFTGAIAISRGLNNRVGGSSFIEGRPLNAIYVYQTDGYLQSREEVDAYYDEITAEEGGEHPVQGTSDQLTPGCVKKVDLNGDGRITTDDLYYYGDANPHYTFGITLGARYRNFDFSMFIQGVGQQHMVRDGALSSPFYYFWANQNATFWGKTWTPENTDASFPIMSLRSKPRNNWNYKWYNDINIPNTWYARAKNVVLGYTLPGSMTRRILVENLRVYVAGDNLFEVSNVKDGFDPESPSGTNQGNMDVFARTLLFGVDITF